MTVFVLFFLPNIRHACKSGMAYQNSSISIGYKWTKIFIKCTNSNRSLSVHYIGLNLLCFFRKVFKRLLSVYTAFGYTLLWEHVMDISNHYFNLIPFFWENFYSEGISEFFFGRMMDSIQNWATRRFEKCSFFKKTGNKVSYHKIIRVIFQAKGLDISHLMASLGLKRMKEEEGNLANENEWAGKHF